MTRAVQGASRRRGHGDFPPCARSRLRRISHREGAIVAAPCPSSPSQTTPRPITSRARPACRPTCSSCTTPACETGEAALARLCDPAAKVSAHYMVEEDGRVFAPGARGAPRLARRRRYWARRARHQRALHRHRDRQSRPRVRLPRLPAGADRRADPSRAATSRAPRPSRRAACSAIPTWRPTRKTDPGELFPWRGLAHHGVGLWPPDAETAAAWPRVIPADVHCAAVRDLQDGSPRSATTCRAMRCSMRPPAPSSRAFQRHFRPGRIDGQADEETLARLDRLLDLSA